MSEFQIEEKRKIDSVNHKMSPGIVCTFIAFENIEMLFNFAFTFEMHIDYNIVILKKKNYIILINYHLFLFKNNIIVFTIVLKILL